MSTLLSNSEQHSDDPLIPLLASRVRRERETKGWSIAELAVASGVSKAMISKIERAEASPTATLLGKLSGAFGLSVSTLLARAEADGEIARVTRAQDQPQWTDPETGYIRRTLSPPGTEPEMTYIELPPGAKVRFPAASYAFMRGHSLWVMSGKLTLTEGQNAYHLESGDCFSFDLSELQPRTYKNPSASHWAHYVVVLTRA